MMLPTTPWPRNTWDPHLNRLQVLLQPREDFEPLEWPLASSPQELRIWL